MIGAVLERVADPTDNDQLSDAPQAVAVAALIAAQCPGGGPVDPPYGPKTPMPQFPAYLRDLAIKALDILITKPTCWPKQGQSPSGQQRRQTISGLRAVLDPPQQNALHALTGTLGETSHRRKPLLRHPHQRGLPRP